MPEEPKQTPVFLVDAYSEPVLIRIEGRATFQNCAPLKEFFSQTIASGKRKYVVDFSKCSGMDSTFLGVLVGVGLKLRKTQPEGGLALVRLGTRNMELVRNLGLHRIVAVDAGTGTPVPGSGLTQHPLQAQARASELENARFVLEAHENLVAVDSANAAKFQDVIAFLKNRVEQG
jgi:anti-anti-sigma regulatory factor